MVSSDDGMVMCNSKYVSDTEQSTDYLTDDDSQWDRDSNLTGLVIGRRQLQSVINFKMPALN